MGLLFITIKNKHKLYYALRQQTGQQSDPNSTQFTVIVLPPISIPQQLFNLPMIPSVNTELNGFKDPSPTNLKIIALRLSMKGWPTLKSRRIPTDLFISCIFFNSALNLFSTSPANFCSIAKLDKKYQREDQMIF
jgi:hypothetical protein